MAEGGGIGIVVDLLKGLLGLFGGSQAATWGSIAGTNDLTFSTLNDSFRTIGEVASKIKGIVKSIWNDIVLAMLKKLLDAYQKLRNLLVKIFAPVLKYLHLLRKLYDQYFNQFVKPVLNVLHKIRQALQIFRLLGFKWAARLDADIARIENKIVSLYTTLRAYLNIATSWIQLIVDPLGILRRNPLLAGLIRSAPELRNLMDQVTVHTQTQKEVDRSNRNNAWFQPSARSDNMTYYTQRQLPPDLAAARQEFLDAQKALPGLADQQLA